MSINKSEFTDFYYNDLHDLLTAREALRLKAKTNFSIARGLIAPFAILTSIFSLGIPWLFIPTIMISCLLFLITYRRSFTPATEGFKQEVIAPLVKFVSDNLNYDPQSHIAYPLFTYSHLFSDVIDIYKGNNHIYGHIDGLKFEYNTIYASRKTNKEYVTFSGMFIVVALPKSSSTTTLVYPRLTDKQHSPPYLHYKRARLEDPEFERAFDAYTDDQVGARVYLTPTMMENILKLVDFLPAKPFFSFRGKRLHIAIPSPSRLRAPLFHSVFDPMIMDRFLEKLDMIVTIPEILGLTNTSISAR
jgi:hypothetical protein